MPGELLLINPRRKRRTRRKMSALQRRYFGKRRRTTRVRRNPRRRSVAALAVNTPVRRSKRRSRRSGRIRRTYSRVRNSGVVRGLGGFAMQKVLPAGIGAAGALAVDMAWANLPLPSFLQTGPAAPIARIGLAVGVGYVAGWVAGKKFGQEAMNGAIVVTLYDLLKTQLSATWPGAIPAGTSGYVDGYVSGPQFQGSLPGPGQYFDDYEMDWNMGYVSPAPIVG